MSLTHITPNPVRLLIVSGPSGAGKSSLTKALLTNLDKSLSERLWLSISHTTRAQRAGEVDGKDYFFVDTEKFKALQEGDEFLETAEVFDNFYGTSEKIIREKLAAGKSVLLEIDWQGAAQVRAKMSGQCYSIFIHPPSIAHLKDRLIKRKRDERATIERRLKEAKNEINQAKEFDYAIYNHDFDEALAQLTSTVTALLSASPVK